MVGGGGGRREGGEEIGANGWEGGWRRGCGSPPGGVVKMHGGGDGGEWSE